MNTKKRASFFCVIVAGLFVASSSNVAWAQRPAHYYPSRPPISPYFGYSAINLTGVPNYYTYVRPSTQFQEFADRRVTLSANQGDARITEERLGEILNRQLEMRRTTGIGAPAMPATFQDYSHFYRPNSLSGRPPAVGLRPTR